jgi:hypothetical protein
VGLRSDGTLWAWGNNDTGQLGTGDAWKEVPSQIGTGTDWTAAFTLASEDTKGAVAFTIDSVDTAGNAGTRVTATRDGTTVTLVEPSSPPVVYSQEVSTTAGVPVTITLTGSDADGDTLGWAIVLPVTRGATDYVALSQTTNTIDVVFTPNSGFIGTASFMFYATDASSASNTATVNINVSPAATPTPAPASAVATPTPIPNLWDAPSTSSWGLAALVAGMLVVLVIALRLTSGSRRGVRP